MADIYASLFGEVRSLLSQPLTSKRFNALLQCLGTLQDKHYLEALLIPYCLDSPQFRALDFRPFDDAPLHYWTDPRALLTNVLRVKPGEPGFWGDALLPLCMTAPFMRNIQWLTLDEVTWDGNFWNAFLTWERLPQIKCLSISCWGLSVWDVKSLLTQDLPKLEVLILEGSYFSAQEQKTLRQIADSRQDFDLLIIQVPEV